MKEKTIKINSEYITLGQLLKVADVIQSGGMAKWYLSEYFVYVNDEEEQRRGRKLYDGYHVELPNEELMIHIVNRDK